MSGRYIPPHLRGLNTPTNAGDTSSHAKTAPHASEVEETAKEREEAERARHPDMMSVETKTLEKYFSDNSKIFRDWNEARSRGYTNQHIAHFFEKKNTQKESNGLRAGAHAGANIKPIFTQFYKYAIDIDNGLAYSERAIDVANDQGSCWFLDFGFAPGGMADLLLCADDRIKGVGVTLEPSEGGNVYLESLNGNDRFTPYIGDVIDMARDDLDLVAACNLPCDFQGFDLVVVGITIHQNWEGENMNELKDLLHFAQLYFAFKYLRPGGMVMMRMHMSVRLVDCHFLSLMLSMFNIEKFTGLQAGMNRLASHKVGNEKTVEKAVEKPVISGSKLDMMYQKMSLAASNRAPLVNNAYAWNALARTAVASKPFSTFSMRKTYWVLYHGFDCSAERRTEVMKNLQLVMEKNIFAYGFNPDKNCFNRSILMQGSIENLLGDYGDKMISVLEDVWAKQVVALEGFMKGQTDKFCRDGISCRRRHCNMAHSHNEMIPQVMDALRAVDARARSRLLEISYN